MSTDVASQTILTPVDEALAFVLEQTQIIVAEVSIPLLEARGRTLAADIIAPLDVPPYDNSAMDGYAVRVAEVSLDNALPISSRITAGSVGNPLQRGTAARIFTGAPIPVGADAVVMQENTHLQAAGVCINVLPIEKQNIRTQGQDIKKGALIFLKGRLLKAVDIGLIASLGFDQVSVYRKLKVAVLSTGDELVMPPLPLAPGQIYNSNQFTLLALLAQLGMEALDCGSVSDTAEATEACLIDAAKKADCIISSGGVSVGEEDHVKAAVEKLGELSLWKLAIKPGKPLAFGKVAGTPFFGLPGNPVSSFVTFTIVARPYLLKAQGRVNFALPSQAGIASFSTKAGSRREYIRVHISCDANGDFVVSNFGEQGSGILSSVSWANALAVIEPHQKIETGELISVLLLD